jgi:cytidyltransferase-like protein
MNRSIAIVSGYFNPLHVGHVRMIRAARELADLLVVIVNNDAQQILKKGRVIIAEDDRLEVVASLRAVDKALLAVDQDGTVRATLGVIRDEFPEARLVFANGGDRRDVASIAEADVCSALGIEIAFGVGGDDKADASSRIIGELGV